jgi:cytochrome b pre-mRNA-processing protein 3
MVFRLFRRAANQAVIDRLYTRIVAAARDPVLFSSFGIPDTFEGRFESLTLHAALVLRRLKAADSPGPDMAQDLVDTIFKHFDRTFREMGVGDMAVPKRMKTMAEAFLGRAAAYDEALRSTPDDLTVCLARNMNIDGRDVPALAHYVKANVTALAAQPLQAFIDGDVRFSDPAPFAKETM